MKEKTKIKDIPEGPGKGNIRRSKCDEDEKKAFESTHKIESVNKFDEIDLETAKLEVGDVSKDKGKDANVAETADEAGENGTISDLLCSYWLCCMCIGILKLWGRSFWDLTDDIDKSNALGICGVGGVPDDTPVQKDYKA
ncbi:14866_t:CDS:2, partial [Gigaspora rosea]